MKILIGYISAKLGTAIFWNRQIEREYKSNWKR